MTLIATIPAIFALIGLLTYALTSHKSAGRVVMGCGLVVVLYVLSGHVVRL